MKSLVLLKKELRESLVPMLLVALIFSGLAIFMVHAFVRYSGDDYGYYVSNARSGYVGGLFHRHHNNEIGIILMFASISLGAGLGVLHFWMPLLTRTWAFFTHRSVSRGLILGAKLLAAALAFGACLGIPWSWIYAYGNQVKTTGFPANPQVLWEGWLFIALGYVLYLGTALAAMSTARWYSTRFFGLVFTALIMFVVFLQSSILTAFGLLLTCMAILMVQLFSSFSQREF